MTVPDGGWRRTSVGVTASKNPMDGPAASGSERCAGPGRRFPRKPPSDGRIRPAHLFAAPVVPHGVPPRENPLPSVGLSLGRPPPNDRHRVVAVLMIPYSAERPWQGGPHLSCSRVAHVTATPEGPRAAVLPAGRRLAGCPSLLRDEAQTSKGHDDLDAGTEANLDAGTEKDRGRKDHFELQPFCLGSAGLCPPAHPDAPDFTPPNGGLAHPAKAPPGPPAVPFCRTASRFSD